MALPFFTAAALPTGGRRRHGAPALLARHAAYLSAMRRMCPHRALPAADMGFHQALVEPVMHNACIRLPVDGVVFTAASAPPLAAALARHGVQRLRDLRRAVREHPADGELAAVVELLPPPWRAAVTRVVEPAHGGFYSNTAGSLAATSLAFGSPGCVLYAVLPDGRLAREALQPPPPPSVLLAMAWQPAHVVALARPVALMTLEERLEVKEALRRGIPRQCIIVAFELYFVGPWASLPLCPETWAVGEGMTLTSYIVRLATLRCRRIRAAAEVPGYQPGKGIFPKAWEAVGGGGGIAAVEARWVQELQSRAPPPPAGDGGAGPSDPAAAQAARLRRQFAQGWQPAGWLRLPHHDPGQLLLDGEEDLGGSVGAAQGRQRVDDDVDSIARRVRARHEPADGAVPAPGLAAGQAAVPFFLPDHHDVAAPPPGTQPGPARGAWKRLMEPSLPRDARALAWRLLHVSLYSSVFWAYVTRQSVVAACCASPACGAGCPETSQHLFLSCPDVAAAADWLVRLWAAIVGPAEAPPPRTAAVLLADDHRVWKPAGGEERVALWSALRLSWLSAVWAQRCRRLADPARSTVSPAGIVSATVAAVTRLLRRDYTRTVSDARTLTPSPRDWFRGRASPVLAREEFLKRWGVNGVLCSLSPGNAQGQGFQLLVHLSTMHPVVLQ